MNIGIDIDGCLNNMQEELLKIALIDYGVVIPKTQYDVFSTLFGNNEFIWKNFWDKYGETMYKIKCSENADKVTNELSKKNKLSIVTARDYVSANNSVDWLAKNNIKYDNIFFNSGEKVDVCKWQNIKIMIEDKHENAMLLAENDVTVLLYNREYNLNTKHKNIVRVNNWDEILNLISKINSFEY